MEEIEGQEPEIKKDEAGPSEPATPEQDSGLSVDALQAEIAKLRKENASRRVKSKELEEKAKKFDEIEAANMSAQEKMQKELEDLRKEKALSDERAKRAELKALGIDEKTVSLINIESLDFSDAESLKEQLSHLITPPQRKAETPPPDGKRQDSAWTLDRLANASREEILENLDAANAAMNGGGARKNRL